MYSVCSDVRVCWKSSNVSTRLCSEAYSLLTSLCAVCCPAGCLLSGSMP
jgi:hypothetical protein